MPEGQSSIGATLRFEKSPYVGRDKSYDFLPVLRYDSEYWYLSSYRAGVKLGPAEVFVKRRFEGYPSDDVPTSMLGVPVRRPGVDVGVALKQRFGNGTAYVEAMTDAENKSDGSELRVGYRYEGWWSGRWRWRPYATLAWRSANLNNYYYGVPGYTPGAGVDLEVGAIATYALNENWQLIGGLELTRYSSAMGNSPAVDKTFSPAVTIGLMYGFKPEGAPPGDSKPLIMRAFYGASTDCNLFPITTAQCTSTYDVDNTGVAAVEVGRTLMSHINGWNLDLQGFVGLLRHLDDGNQPDGWQAEAYYKVSYYGFPWREKVRTRVGFGMGVAYAARLPFAEARDQAKRDRDASKFLLYLDPNIDVSVGDLFGVRSLRDTYFGFGVSHRSGIFGFAQLFNNVNGGSNYIYAHLETSF